MVQLTAVPVWLQVFHALFENIHVDYKYSPANQSARFAVYSVQIDNQLLSSTHPVVLCHTSSGEQSLHATTHGTLQAAGHSTMTSCLSNSFIEI